MQLYFIRHAQSANNALWAGTGSDEGRSHDPELTEIGKKQAGYLAKFFKENKEASKREGDQYPFHGPTSLTHIYCSLMVRSVATGMALAQAVDLPLHGLEEIYEEGGIYEDDPETGQKIGLPGYGEVYFSKHYPDLVLPDSVNPAGWWSRDYEQPEQRPERARRALKNILALHEESDDRVALVSHGGFYNLFIKALLDIQDTNRYWFTLNNTGITRIDFKDDWVGLAYCNRTDFLPTGLIT
jgi:2,3-bisphosphoglycerate-dependent phosphoglycerate mutase